MTMGCFAEVLSPLVWCRSLVFCFKVDTRIPASSGGVTWSSGGGVGMFWSMLVLLVVVVHDIDATNVIDIHGRGHVIQSSC